MENLPFANEQNSLPKIFLVAEPLTTTFISKKNNELYK